MQNIGLKLWVKSIVLGGAFLCFAPMALAEPTRVTNPNALSVEVLGRGIGFSLNYDHVMSDQLVAGFGWGRVATQTDTGVDAGTVSTIPVYVHYYFLKEQGSPFVTLGATVFTDSSGKTSPTGNFKLPTSSVMADLGVGYENRGETGFLFRAAGYGLLGTSFKPWLGIAFGYAF